MGSGYTVSCTCCEYKEKFYLGVGFNYPEVYESAMKQAVSGKLDDVLQGRLVKMYPGAAIDPTLVLLRCPECNCLDSRRKLSLHLPKAGYDRNAKRRVPWCSAKSYFDIDYVSPGEFRENYELLRAYDHICAQCGGLMQVVEESDIQNTLLNCPECGGKLKVDRTMMWD